MNEKEIITLQKNALYSSLMSRDIFGKFFNKSILHYATIMEIFSNNIEGISYEKLCDSIPKTIGSRSSIQNLLNEGIDKSIFVKIECKEDKRIKKYYLTKENNEMMLKWVKQQKHIYNV